MNIRNTSYVLVVALLLACGSNRIKDINTFNQWINDASNGLVKTKYVNGLRLQLKLLPANYLILKDYLGEERRTEGLLDSLQHTFQNNLVFILNIGPDQREGQGSDIMFADTKDYQEYKDRFIEMSFFLEDKISLQAGEKQYRPVLTSLENVYGLKPDRNVNVAFVPTTENDKDFYHSEELIFTFEDDIFETGISNFKFNRKDLKNAPQLKI